MCAFDVGLHIAGNPPFSRYITIAKMFCPNAKLCVKGAKKVGPKELLGPRPALPHKEIGEGEIIKSTNQRATKTKFKKEKRT